MPPTLGVGAMPASLLPFSSNASTGWSLTHSILVAEPLAGISRDISQPYSSAATIQTGRKERENSRDEPDFTIPGSLGILNMVWKISGVFLRSQGLLKSLETHILVADLWSSES